MRAATFVLFSLLVATCGQKGPLQAPPTGPAPAPAGTPTSALPSSALR